MTAQDHEYELGTLDQETLERDESLARKRQQRGDERRWMILGGAGTLALMAGLVGAISLGGSSEPHHLAASLGSPVRDIAPLAAKAIVDQEPETEADEPTSPSKKTQVAHKGTTGATSAATTADEPRASAAIPAATSSAARPTPVPAPTHTPTKADEDDGTPFAGLPTLPAVTDADEDDEPADDFEHDDSPFVDEDTVEDDGSEADEPEADAPEPEADEPQPEADAPAAAPVADDAPAPAPAAEEAPELPTPV